MQFVSLGTFPLYRSWQRERHKSGLATLECLLSSLLLVVVVVVVVVAASVAAAAVVVVVESLKYLKWTSVLLTLYFGNIDCCPSVCVCVRACVRACARARARVCVLYVHRIFVVKTRTFTDWGSSS